jgi:hypothetical protein
MFACVYGQGLADFLFELPASITPTSRLLTGLILALPPIIEGLLVWKALVTRHTYPKCVTS